MLNEKHILSKWEEDFEKGLYFTRLKNGDSIGYNYELEQFSLNNYWNERPFEEVEQLIKKYGVDD